MLIVTNLFLCDKFANIKTNLTIHYYNFSYVLIISTVVYEIY